MPIPALSAPPGLAAPALAEATAPPAPGESAPSFAELMAIAAMPAGEEPEEDPGIDPDGDAPALVPPPPPVLAAMPGIAPQAAPPAPDIAQGGAPPAGAPMTSAAGAAQPMPGTPAAGSTGAGAAGEAPQGEAMPAQPSGPPAAAPAEPPFPLAPAGSAPPPESAPSPVILARPDPARPVQAGAVPFVLASRIAGGERRIEIRLDPQELGRVEVSVTFEREAARVVIAVERPEAYAALAREQKALERALAEAGLGGSETSLAFSPGGDSRDGRLPRDARTPMPGGPGTIRVAGQARLAPDAPRPHGGHGLDLTV
jgi:hypothetical protein